MRNVSSRRAAALVVACALFVPAAGALAYDYFYAHILLKELEQHVGRKVSVVDPLVKVWEWQDNDRYIRFDTENFRCAVPAEQAEAIAYLREVEKKRAAGDVTPPLVHLLGTVSREPIFGPVKGGESDGVVSETILILCDRVEKARPRFHDEGR